MGKLVETTKKRMPKTWFQNGRLVILTSHAQVSNDCFGSATDEDKASV